MPDHAACEPLLQWYARSKRDLPWRRADATPWAVLVSEVMLQQTPVSRVLAVYERWLTRWPSPAALASEKPGEAVREWGRLGYPRRALRLHAASVAIDQTHGGQVPSSYDDLLALPGVGDYTAAAVAAFAFGRRTLVLDTNVRRVLARLVCGEATAPLTIRRAERLTAESVLPDLPARAAAWSVAVMELGATVCTARSPGCVDCPVAGVCAWRAAGQPPAAGPTRRRQSYVGTDRQCRGRLLGLLRDSDGPLRREVLDVAWPDAGQRERALASLIDDGLVVAGDEGSFSLP